MPIRPFSSSSEIALRIEDCDDDVRQALAKKIIELSKTGERNPDVLCEHALKEIRQAQPKVPGRLPQPDN